MDHKAGANIFREFWINVAKLTSGAVLSQAIIFFTIPVMTRLYTPEHFGVAAIFTSIVLFASPMSSLCYHQAIMLPENQVQSDSISYLSIFIVFFVAIFLFVPFGFYSKSVSAFFSAPDLEKVLWLLPFAIFIRGIYMVMAVNSSRNKEFGLQAVSTIVKTLVDRLIILGAGFLGYVTGDIIVLGRFFASLCETGTFFLTFRRLSKSWKRIQFSSIRHMAVKYRKFPLFASWVTFFSLGATHLPIYALAFFFSPTVTGLYAMSDRLLKTPMQLLGTAMGQVSYQTVADGQQNKKALQSFFRPLRLKLFGYGLFPFLLLSVISKEVFLLVLGPTWAETCAYVSILCFLVGMQFISTPIAGMVNVLGKQKEFLGLTFFLFLSRFIALVIGGVNKDPFLALWLFVISGVLFYGYLHFWIGTCIGIKKKETLKVFVKYAGGNFIFLGILYGIKFLLIGGIVFWAAILISVLLFYIIMLYWVDDIVVFSKLRSLLNV